ncbi:MAG: TraB/GumN family protein [Candidatus Hadarchaeia archaeon]
MIRDVGDRLTLVGVAHILPKSRLEVERAIAEKEPETVCVELCPSRYLELTGQLDEDDRRIEISRAGILSRILKFVQDKMAERTGMLPGEEMLTAVERAEEMNSEIKLIDRDINITMHRLVNELSFRDKLSLLFEIVKSMIIEEGEMELNDLTEEGTVEALVESFRDLSEPAYRILIEERNDYMASKISRIMRTNTGNVVCVIGAGHVPGMIDRLEALKRKGDLDIWSDFSLEWEISRRADNN